MDFTALITVLTTFFSVAVKVVGMPAQIRNNNRRKSTSGLSGWFMISTFVSYVLWVVHGVQVHDMSLVIGQGLGTLVTVVIIVQMFIYRSTPEPKTQKMKSARPTLLWFTAMQTGVFRRGTQKRQTVPSEE